MLKQAGNAYYTTDNFTGLYLQTYYRTHDKIVSVWPQFGPHLAAGMGDWTSKTGSVSVLFAFPPALQL